MSTDVHRLVQETDPRVGGIVVMCDGCGELTVANREFGDTDYRRDLASGYPHACKTTTTTLSFEIVHAVAATSDEVARAIMRAIRDDDRDNHIATMRQVTS